MGRHVTQSEQETRALGEALAAELSGGEVVLFTGGLGAGKTIFCQGLACGLGVQDPVHSPTYAIVNLYRGHPPLAHFDAWRVESEEDLEAAGYYDYLAEGAVVAVEWGENVQDFLEGPWIRVDIQAVSPTGRAITIEGAAGL